MFHFFSQKRLKNRGFSSGQKRRKTTESAVSEMMRYSWQVRGSIFFLFAVLISLWLIFFSSPDSVFGQNPLQIMVVVGLITATLMIHWHVSQTETFRRNSRVTLMLLVIVAQLLLIKLSEFLAMTFAPEGGFRFIVEPYIFAPMVMSLLIGRRHGTFAVIYASLLAAMTVAKEEAFFFVIFSMVCGFVAIFLTDRVRRRSRLMSVGVYVGLACVLLALALGQIQWPGFSAIGADWELFGKKAISTILVSTFTAVIVSGILPMIEILFRITTDVSWIELADLNHPLLKRLTIEAPGTYHHSLVVATLSETAAEAVGANAPMCRVCSYFHDIGKMSKPLYFVENIGEGDNPHDELTPNMSALIVMAHVKDGVDLALKHKLNREIIDVIREHHGTSLTRFFYHRALQHRDEIRELVKEEKAHEEDVPEVKKESFRYAGPCPGSRESAIISLADAVESASRSMQKPTPKKIEELIEEIVKDRLNDHQLDHTALTLADLATIKGSFAVTMRSMMHNRIAYPKIDDSEGKKKKSDTKKLSESRKVKDVKSEEKEADQDGGSKKESSKAS